MNKLLLSIRALLYRRRQAAAGTERVQRILADMRARSPRGLIEIPAAQEAN